MDPLETLPLFLLLSAAFLLLTWMSRQVSLRVQAVIYYLSGWAELASVVLFLLWLPGIFLHESAHWLAARAVGLRTGRFRVWPVRQGKFIGLGSVSVERSDIWRESLVGVAPLLAGNGAIAWVGWHFFATPVLVDALAAGELALAAASFWQSLGTADGLVWAYLVFAVGNSMLPSSSDREPFKAVLLYTLFAGLLYCAVGLPLAPLQSLLRSAIPLFELTAGALLFLLLLDALWLALLWPVEQLLRARVQAHPEF